LKTGSEEADVTSGGRLFHTDSNGCQNSNAKLPSCLAYWLVNVIH